MCLSEGICRDSQLKKRIHQNVHGTIPYAGVPAGRKVNKGESWEA